MPRSECAATAPYPQTLGLGTLSDPKVDLFVAVTIALAERAADKLLDALRTPAEIKTALDAVDSNGAPDLLISLWRKRRLKQEHLRVVLLDVWRYLDNAAAWPMRTWRAMFRYGGFLSDREPRPTRPMTVYRGCTPSRRCGMSWDSRTLDGGEVCKFSDGPEPSNRSRTRSPGISAHNRPNSTKRGGSTGLFPGAVPAAIVFRRREDRRRSLPDRRRFFC